jgi:hypothetical protein
VKGNRVQEYIKSEIADLHAADESAEKKNPSVFGGFVDNVTLKNTDAGSDYVKVVYDVTRHMFFAVTMNGETEQYHRLYDQFDIYNDGEFPNAHPYSGKLYLCETTVYVWNGEALVSTTPEASEEAVRDIVRNWEPPQPDPEPEP